MSHGLSGYFPPSNEFYTDIYPSCKEFLKSVFSAMTIAWAATDEEATPSAAETVIRFTYLGVFAQTQCGGARRLCTPCEYIKLRLHKQVYDVRPLLTFESWKAAFNVVF